MRKIYNLNEFLDTWKLIEGYKFFKCTMDFETSQVVLPSLLPKTLHYENIQQEIRFFHLFPLDLSNE